jgi:hypothetical protein
MRIVLQHGQVVNPHRSSRFFLISPIVAESERLAAHECCSPAVFLRLGLETPARGAFNKAVTIIRDFMSRRDSWSRPLGGIEMKPQWKWIGLIGAALLAFTMADIAQANYPYGTYGGYGYGNYGYAQTYPSYGYPVPAYPSYGYSSGFNNRTEEYHYTGPRVTTGQGFQTYPRYAYPVYPSYYGGGNVNVRYPRGGVNVNYGRRGGVQVYGGFGNINVGW